MTITNVYIGRLSDGPDPLDWGGDFGIANTPVRIGPFFPPAPGAYEPFFTLIRKIKQHELAGKQIDWGAWAARVSKADILAFIETVYRDDPTYIDPTYMPHLHPMLQSLKDFVVSLPDEDFALAGSEL